jgi:hypothetical protein
MPEVVWASTMYVRPWISVPSQDLIYFRETQEAPGSVAGTVLAVLGPSLVSADTCCVRTHLVL